MPMNLGWVVCLKWELIGMKQPKSAAAAKDFKSMKSRGTQDDVELLKLIIDEHPGLKKRILEKMRVTRAMQATSTGSKSPKDSEKG